MDYRNRDGSTDGNKYTENFDTPSKNVLLLRADLVDFWHLCLTSPEWQQKVCVHKHYLLYPNPYPKKARLKSRFYVHPAFPLLMLTMMMGGNDADRRMIVRSNWEGYLKEFSIAVKVWEESGLSFNRAKDAAILDSMGDTDDTCGGEHTDTQYWIVNGPKRLCNKNAPMTNFEAKYFACGEPAYEIQVTFQTSSKEDS
jgi:tRNA G46 methylase TrmB